MTMPSASPDVSPPFVIGEDRVSDNWSGSVPTILVNHRVDAVCCQYLSALAQAVSESAWISLPRYSGPTMP
jgi:hypothetical protein